MGVPQEVCLYAYMHVVEAVPATVLVEMQGIRQWLPMCDHCYSFYAKLCVSPPGVKPITHENHESNTEQ